MKAANRYVDYESFDKDGDGLLSPSELHISIIAAGYETSYGGADDVCGPSVWGHQGALLGGGPKVDGVGFEPEGRHACRGSGCAGPTTTPDASRRSGATRC